MMSQLFSDLLSERVEASLLWSRCSGELSCCRAPPLICLHIYREAEARPDVYPTICLFFSSLLVGTFTCCSVHEYEQQEPVSGPREPVSGPQEPVFGPQEPVSSAQEPVDYPLPSGHAEAWCSMRTVFSCGCTCSRDLRTMKMKITDAPVRVCCCTPVFGSAWLKCTCVSVDAEEEPVPAHINQAAVFGRVIRGVPEASFLWRFWFSCRFFAEDAFISSVCICVCVFACVCSQRAWKQCYLKLSLIPESRDFKPAVTQLSN